MKKLCGALLVFACLTPHSARAESTSTDDLLRTLQSQMTEAADLVAKRSKDDHKLVEQLLKDQNEQLEQLRNMDFLRGRNLGSSAYYPPGVGSFAATMLDRLQSEAEFDSRRSTAYAEVAHDPNAADALTFKEILSHLDSPENKSGVGDIRSSDEFLKFLKQRSPDLFREAAIMYSSVSSQADAVSPKYPRFIAHKDRITIAMVSDPSHPKYRQFEIIDTDPKNGKETFRRITFPPAGSKDTRVQVEHEGACIQCHGTPLRKIWGTYNLWPGAFGSTGDDMSSLFTVKKTFAEHPEKKLFKEFIDNLPNNPRARLFGTTESDFYSKLVAVTDHFARLNGLRILGDLKANPEFYSKYKFAIYGAVASCPNIESFLPDDVRKETEKNLGGSYKKLFDETNRINTEERLERRNRFFHHFHLDPNEYLLSSDPDDGDIASYRDFEDDSVAELRYLVEGQTLADIDTTHWSTSFTPNPGQDKYSFAFTTPSRGGLHDFFRKVYWPAMQKDRTLAGHQTCEGLRSKSLAAFSSPGRGVASQPHEHYRPFTSRITH